MGPFIYIITNETAINEIYTAYNFPDKNTSIAVIISEEFVAVC
jgi:hypothetical protein